MSSQHSQYNIYDSHYLHDKKAASVLGVENIFEEAKKTADKHGEGTVVTDATYEKEGDGFPFDEEIVYIVEAKVAGDNEVNIFRHQYPILTGSFAYNNHLYNVCITPRLYYESDGLEFTGGYHCAVIASHRGTNVFEIIPDESMHWQTEPKGIDPGLVDELSKLINAYRNS